MDQGALGVLDLGLLLGARHALEADHVVAVSTLVSHSRSVLAAARLWLCWGLGHTAMLALCGLPVLFLRLRIPAGAERLELAVAAMLVVLGVLTVRDHVRKRVHLHRHEHDGWAHVHFHRHDGDGDHAHSHAVPGGMRAFLVGMVHGLAGTAALVLLLMGMIGSPWLAGAYVLVFGLSSTAAMSAVTLVMAVPVLLSGERLPALRRVLGFAAGLTSVALGVSLAWRLL